MHAEVARWRGGRQEEAASALSGASGGVRRWHKVELPAVPPVAMRKRVYCTW